MPLYNASKRVIISYQATPMISDRPRGEGQNVGGNDNMIRSIRISCMSKQPRHPFNEKKKE